ncbi:MAG: response regulator transcription factor [Coriobacteriia bacterium]|nr:response regulator transcription factor [Coriobacteriia bacterium]MBS5479197.1 response regulator transcription factor [Coriobacteriia bacterium]
MNVLVVEDENNLAEALAHIMREQHWGVDVVNDGRQGFDYGKTGMYDVIVLDVMLPEMDGFEVARKLRAQSVSTPILMLTARSEVKDKVDGLDCGADDYMTKPFNPEELLARLRALSRRTGDVVLNTLSFGDLTLDLSDMNLSCGSNSVHLSWRESEVMKLLMSNPQTTLAKSTLLTRVWGTQGDAGANNVEAYISFLRKKLSLLGSTVSIRTIRMLGYRLDTPDAQAPDFA